MRLLKTSCQVMAVVCVQKIPLGMFDSPEEAAKAYDRHAIKTQGMTAKTNFPLTYYPELSAAAGGSYNQPVRG